MEKKGFLDTPTGAYAGLVLTFINGNIGAGIAFGGAFALTRFRSAQGTSDEIVTVLAAMAAGCAFGMGYIAYGVLTLAADETEALREEARKTAAEKRNRRVTDAAAAF